MTSLNRSIVVARLHSYFRSILNFILGTIPYFIYLILNICDHTSRPWSFILVSPLMHESGRQYVFRRIALKLAEVFKLLRHQDQKKNNQLLYGVFSKISVMSLDSLPKSKDFCVVLNVSCKFKECILKSLQPSKFMY